MRNLNFMKCSITCLITNNDASGREPNVFLSDPATVHGKSFTCDFTNMVARTPRTHGHILWECLFLQFKGKRFLSSSLDCVSIYTSHTFNNCKLYVEAGCCMDSVWTLLRSDSLHHWLTVRISEESRRWQKEPEQRWERCSHFNTWQVVKTDANNNLWGSAFTLYLFTPSSHFALLGKKAAY